MAIQSLLPYSWSRNGATEFEHDPFSVLQQEMNRLFESVGNYPAGRWSNGMSPRLDVSETDKEIDIDADLPGIEEKDVEVTLSGDKLIIRGERRNGHETKNKDYHLSERSWGEFTRQVSLPFEADPKKISAKFDKGVLHIAIPKPETMTAKTAKIPVRAA